MINVPVTKLDSSSVIFSRRSGIACCCCWCGSPSLSLRDSSWRTCCLRVQIISAKPSHLHKMKKIGEVGDITIIINVNLPLLQGFQIALIHVVPISRQLLFALPLDQFLVKDFSLDL